MYIFEKKHHYYNILSEVSKLKEMKKNDEFREIEKKNLNYIYNSAFIGLLMEQIPCAKVLEGNVNIIRLEIGNEIFDCPDAVLKRMLKDNYDKLISNNKVERKEIEAIVSIAAVQDVIQEQVLPFDALPVGGSSVEEIQAERVQFKDTLFEEVPTSKTIGKSLEDVNLETEELKKEQEGIVEPDIKSADVELEEMEQEIKVVIREAIKEEVEIKEPEQLNKKKEQLIFDHYKLTIKGQESVYIDEVELRVMPINIPLGRKKVAAADILVFAKSGESELVAVSKIEGRKSLTINTGNHEFIIRGSWDNGNFKSFVYPTGQTLALKYDVVFDLVEMRPNSLDDCNSGHVVFYAEDGGKISVVPLSLENDTDGLSHIAVCYEQDDTRTPYLTADTKVLMIDTPKGLIQTCGYWEGELFVIDKSDGETNT